MNELDLYYSALLAYRETMAQDKAHQRFLHQTQKAPSRHDKLETIRTRCIIDEEWIKAIEQYLPFIEKAIREDRQFIRQEGETVPIEKAKKVSKSSVSHLARHSDYITHLPEDEADPLLPDKIFITENESNYAVYENRFLYMLLCYTRDFVELRYTKISELGNTYRGSLRINKHIEIGKRTVSFEMSLNDVSKNDRLYEADRVMNEIIERLESIRVQVSALLMTPLMNEVSKAPMVRPPITRTNVLRMNNNFRNAVALYDYLSAYEGPGYHIEEIKKAFSPLTDKMMAEFFEAIPLAAYLTYKYGNDLDEQLKESHRKALEQKALEEAEKKAKQLQMLRERIHEGGETLEEYLLRLEAYSKDLEAGIANMQSEQKKSMEAISRLQDEIAWQKDLEARLKSGLDDLQNKNIQLQTAMESDKLQFARDKDLLLLQHKECINDTVRQWQERVSDITSRCNEEKKNCQLKLQEAERSVSDMKDQQMVLNARLHAYQMRCGEKADFDMTNEENFAQLEKEREWFEKMFKQTWKQTKKRIRRDLLWSKKQENKGATSVMPKEQDDEGNHS